MSKRQVNSSVIHLWLGEVPMVITNVTSFIEQASQVLDQAQRSVEMLKANETKHPNIIEWTGRPKLDFLVKA